MEKYNIPENNSLDSMEGAEKTGIENLSRNQENNIEISPEVEKMVMQKVKDIFEYGTAYAGWGGKKFLNLLDIRENGYFFDTALRDGQGNTIPSEPDKDHGKHINRSLGEDFFEATLKEYKRVHDKLNVEEVTVEISPDNIREYLNHNHLDEKIGDVFKYGYQSNPNLFGYDNRSKYYDPRDVIKNSEEYRLNLKEKEKFDEKVGSRVPYNVTHRVYFYIKGQQGHMGRGLDEEPKDHIVNNPFFRGINLIFDKPDTQVVPMLWSKDEEGGETRDGYPGIGEFTFSCGSFSEKNPFQGIDTQLSLSDPRLIKHLEERFRFIKHKWPEEVGDAKDWREYSIKKGFLTREGDLIDYQSSGFVLKNRIPPRKFKGLVIDLPKNSSDRWGITRNVYPCDVLNKGEKFEDIGDGELYTRFLEFIKNQPLTNEDRIEVFRQEIIKSMIASCKNNPENLVPIYNGLGDLVWPRRIPYEEIVKMKEEETK